jgi:hypothetical protein
MLDANLEFLRMKTLMVHFELRDSHWSNKWYSEGEQLMVEIDT